MRLFRRLLVPLVLCTASTATAQQETGTTALLQVEGDPALSSRLEAELVGALSRQSLTVLSAEQTGRLLRAEKKIADSLHSARKQLKRADEALLRMKKAKAVASSRRAMATLEATGARFHSPRLLSRAHGRLARALLLRPADEKGAVQAFRRAMELDRSYAPDPDRTAPRIRALAKRAHRQLSDPSAPSAATLAKVARAAQVDRLVWVAALMRGDRVQLAVAVFAAKDGVIQHHEHHRVLEQQMVEKAAPLLAKLLGKRSAPTSEASKPTPTPPPAAASQSVVSTPASRPVVISVTGLEASPPPAVAPARPWYKKWWVWTVVAGVVVAGAAVGLGVGLSQSESTPSGGWDIDFSF